MSPRHGGFPAARIRTVATADVSVTVRVIAGEAVCARPAIETVTPIIYLHFTIQPGGRVAQSVPQTYNAFAYIIAGEGTFGADDERAAQGQMVMFSPDGDEVLVANPAAADAPLEVLLIAGVP